MGETSQETRQENNRLNLSWCLPGRQRAPAELTIRGYLRNRIRECLGREPAARDGSADSIQSDSSFYLVLTLRSILL